MSKQNTQNKINEDNKISKFEENVKSIKTLRDLIQTNEVNKEFQNFKDIISQNQNIIGLNNIHSIHNSFSWLEKKSIDKKIALEEEINELKKKLRTFYTQVNQLTSNEENKIEELRKLNEELQSKENINHILPRICEEAGQKILSDINFRNLFQDAKNYDSVVVSIDIRRSTELMLKARKPELFSKFITELSQKLRDAILTNFGIFDKFTGDGILAFFPKFFSGQYAIIRALRAAEDCHKIFDQHYRNSKECFNVFIKDVGLGIGIDYGSVTLVNARNELTVVGIPVVYACRMSGAKAGETLLNQPAKEEICKLSENYIKAIETEINIKNEGIALAYLIEIHNSTFEIPKPEWTQEIKDENKKKNI